MTEDLYMAVNWHNADHHLPKIFEFFGWKNHKDYEYVKFNHQFLKWWRNDWTVPDCSIITIKNLNIDDLLIMKLSHGLDIFLFRTNQCNIDDVLPVISQITHLEHIRLNGCQLILPSDVSSYANGNNSFGRNYDNIVRKYQGIFENRIHLVGWHPTFKGYFDQFIEQLNCHARSGIEPW